jgi:hypothetical protein
MYSRHKIVVSEMILWFGEVGQTFPKPRGRAVGPHVSELRALAAALWPSLLRLAQDFPGKASGDLALRVHSLAGFTFHSLGFTSHRRFSSPYEVINYFGRP